MTYYFTVFALFAFAMGCCVASFMNVCIWRIPRNESVAWPPSHCPKCNARIKWYQNIPIISWCCLRGRCANCHEPISLRYTIVELLGGVLFLLSYFQWGMPFFFHSDPAFGLVPWQTLWAVPVCWLVFTGLILGSFIDLAEQWLPDRVTIGGMILGLPLSYLVPELQGEKNGLDALVWSGAGLAIGFFSLWLVSFVASRVISRIKKEKMDALGFGDVKLIGAVGAFFGPLAVLFTIIVSSFIGALVGVILIVRGRAKVGGFTAVPFGPFLALGTIAWIYWGPALVNWYLRLLTAEPC